MTVADSTGSMPVDGEGFYDALPRVPSFESLSKPDLYADVPAEWIVGVADIADSTGEIAAGRYKTVNLVGAAVVSAMVNALEPRAFPFVFAGDGARFAVWSGARDAAEQALAEVQSWALREFGIRLRAALVPVADILSAGHRLRVARFRASEGVDYAMFSGGGLSWAETEMKTGNHAVAAVRPDATPDLAGLSCRWSNLRARNGVILSAVVLPGPQADDETFGVVARAVLRAGEGLRSGGHPVPARGPDIQYPPPGLMLEARVSHGKRSILGRAAALLAENLFAWLLFRTGLRLGAFDPRNYRAEVAANADYRKFDDGLKMTLDADPETRARIEALLQEAQDAGLVRYGLAVQDEALVTCFVPSPMENTHVHFIDGAGGGYTSAANAIGDMAA